MKSNLTRKIAQVSMLVVSGALVFGVSQNVQAKTSASSKNEQILGLGRLSAEQRVARLEHARELLGGTYGRSVVRTGEAVLKVNGSVYRWMRASLPEKYLKQSDKVAQVVIDEAHKSGFDPVFLMSIIQTESRFNPEAIGGVGEIGLMQIRPETGKWIAQKSGLRWKGKKSLKDPITNIKLGVAYLVFLRESFDSHARLYLAAYNMGQNNVRELRSQDKWPSEYPTRVMQAYVGYYEELKEKIEMASEAAAQSGSRS